MPAVSGGLREGFFKMEKMTILRGDETLAATAWQTTTLFERVKGLLGKDGMDMDETLILNPCHAVHTFFMKFTIDVVFLNSHCQIIALYPDLKPYRATRIHLDATHTIELPAGAITQWNLKKGQHLHIRKAHV